MTLAFGSYASLSGTFAARPAADADQVGRFYFATDTNDLYRDSGTAWVLIGTARTYKVYTALLTQTGTNAPVATVLENTLGGTVVWTRVAAGDYRATLASAFTIGKTHVMPPSRVDLANSIETLAYLSTTSTVTVQTNNSSGDGFDDQMGTFPIEIRVYP